MQGLSMTTGLVQTVPNRLGLHTQTSLDMQVTMECNQSPWNAISDEQRIFVERHDLEPPLDYLCLRSDLLYIILSASMVSISGTWHYPFWFLPFTIRQKCNVNFLITPLSLSEAIGNSFFCNWRTFLSKW